MSFTVQSVQIPVIVGKNLTNYPTPPQIAKFLNKHDLKWTSMCPRPTQKQPKPILWGRLRLDTPFNESFRFSIDFNNFL